MKKDTEDISAFAEEYFRKEKFREKKIAESFQKTKDFVLEDYIRYQVDRQEAIKITELRHKIFLEIKEEIIKKIQSLKTVEK